MYYRQIQIHDIPALFQVRTATRENAFTLEELHRAGITETSVATLLETSHRGWLCEVEQQVVGFSMGNVQTGELWVIAVLPSVEGQGIGAELLRLTEETLASYGCEGLWLITSADPSLRAYSFYHAQGWEDDAVIEADLRMKKKPPMVRP